MAYGVCEVCVGILTTYIKVEVGCKEYAKAGSCRGRVLNPSDNKEHMVSLLL